MTDYTLIRAKRRTMSLQLDRAGNAVVLGSTFALPETCDSFLKYSQHLKDMLENP